MKRKKLLGLFLGATLTVGGLAGQGTLAFAEDNNTLLETETPDKEDIQSDVTEDQTEITDTQKQKESGTKETQTKPDNAESSTEAKTSTYTVKEKNQTQTQEEEENGIAVQSSDPVISGKTITY